MSTISELIGLLTWLTLNRQIYSHRRMAVYIDCLSFFQQCLLILILTTTASGCSEFYSVDNTFDQIIDSSHNRFKTQAKKGTEQALSKISNQESSAIFISQLFLVEPWYTTHSLTRHSTPKWNDILSNSCPYIQNAS